MYMNVHTVLFLFFMGEIHIVQLDCDRFVFFTCILFVFIVFLNSTCTMHTCILVNAAAAAELEFAVPVQFKK